MDINILDYQKRILNKIIEKFSLTDREKLLLLSGLLLLRTMD